MGTKDRPDRKTDQCAIMGCTRAAGAWRVIIDGEVRYVCSRHAAIDRHNREERRQPRWMERMQRDGLPAKDMTGRAA